MTINEIQQKRKSLETQVLAAVNKFEEETMCEITSIDYFEQEYSPSPSDPFVKRKRIKVNVSL